MNRKRDKKFWGFAGGLVGGVFNLLGSKSSADNAIRQAQLSANAQIRSAQIQADAMARQTEANNAMQQKMIDFQKQQFDDAKHTEQLNQLNNYMQAGMSAEEERKRSGLIQLRNGGKLSTALPLRGSYNGLRVTDGDLPLIGITPEGFPTRMAIGDDHKHYHKTEDGTWRSGVGLKLKNGKAIEVEGNQGSPVGEIVVELPNGILALSKHNIKGYNPAKDVLFNGQNPLVAAAIQESIKDKYGISDSGKAKYGCARKLRNGGRIKAYNGIYQNMPNMPYIDTTEIDFIPTFDDLKRATTLKRNLANNNSGGLFRNWNTGDWFNLGAAGANIGLNFLSTGIANRGAAKAASIINAGNTEAANRLIDAYNKMDGIDINAIKSMDFTPAQVLAFTAPYFANRNSEIELLNRTGRNLARRINNTTLSSAAANNRINQTIDNIQQNKDKIYAEVANEQSKQGIANIQEVNRANQVQAQLNASSKNYRNSLLADIYKYNNNIENAKIAGIGQVQAGNIQQNAQLAGSLASQRATNWSNLLANSGDTISKTINAITTRQDNYNQYQSGLDLFSEVRARMRNNTPADHIALMDIYNTTTEPNIKKQIGTFLGII